MESEITNKVANSPLITIDLEDFFVEGERAVIDLKDNLENGFLLREKNFREFIKDHNWEDYRNKLVSVYCSEDVIIPKWAYMLVATKLAGVARKVVYGDSVELERKLFAEQIENIVPEEYKDKKVVVKGCGKKEVPESVFLAISLRLAPFVSSLMYGEPCSTVPVFKKLKVKKN